MRLVCDVCGEQVALTDADFEWVSRMEDPCEIVEARVSHHLKCSYGSAGSSALMGRGLMLHDLPLDFVGYTRPKILQPDLHCWAFFTNLIEQNADMPGVGKIFDAVWRQIGHQGVVYGSR